MLILLVVLLLVSFYLLAILADEFFVPALDVISQRLKLSQDVAGATFMAIGSSAPEFFTALLAVFRSGAEDVGVGTIVGSAIFNILVIIGVSALFRSAVLHWQPVVRDSLFYSLSIVVLLVSFWDGKIVLPEAVVFVVLYGAYIFAVTRWRKWFPYKDDEDPIELLEESEEKVWIARMSRKMLALLIPDCQEKQSRYVGTFVMSVVMIAVLSYALVEAAVGIGAILEISPVIISLTVLAAGTSIPDLLSSAAVARKGRGDVAISNAVGSNIFDILIGLGLPWMLVIGWKMIRGGDAVVPVGTENLISSVFLLFATLVATFFLIWLRNWRIGPKAGWLLILVYLGYLGYSVVQVVGR